MYNSNEQKNRTLKMQKLSKTESEDWGGTAHNVKGKCSNCGKSWDPTYNDDSDKEHCSHCGAMIKSSNKKELLVKISKAADELEELGFDKEASALTKVMQKIAQMPAMGTNAVMSSLDNATAGLQQVLGALGNLAAGTGRMEVSALQQLWGVATLPVQVGQELVNMGVSAVTQPYISQIQTLQTQNTQLYQTMVNLLRQGNTTTAQQVANQMLPGVQKQLQLTKGVSDMLKQRMQAGQFKADPALMQRYFDFAAQNRMNLRQLYEHALKNNSENFANNLMAVAKAKGIVDQNTVIPQGFQVNAGLAPQVTAPMGAGAAGAIQ
jgi:hypothetical protein